MSTKRLDDLKNELNAMISTRNEANRKMNSAKSDDEKDRCRSIMNNCDSRISDIKRMISAEENSARNGGLSRYQGGM